MIVGAFLFQRDNFLSILRMVTPKADNRYYIGTTFAASDPIRETFKNDGLYMCI